MRIPFLTLGLGAVAGLLLALPPAGAALLYFDLGQLAAGNPIGLLTGHFMHIDGAHLAWNLAGLVVLGGLIEQRSRSLLLAALAAGIVTVDLLLLSPLSELVRYCGLSGVLNSLLGVALFLLWRETRSPWLPLLALLCLGKIAVELGSGGAIFTRTAWPPFAAAHLAGLIGAGFVVWWAGADNKYPVGA